MNTKPFALVALLAGCLALLAGCVTALRPDAAQDSTKYTIGNTEKFVTLDKASQTAVACTGLRERVRPDGRFEVVANVKNREAEPLALQINCVFRDMRGFPTGDETAFQTLKLEAGATETVRFTAANALGKRYTIRVREAR